MIKFEDLVEIQSNAETFISKNFDKYDEGYLITSDYNFYIIKGLKEKGYINEAKELWINGGNHFYLIPRKELEELEQFFGTRPTPDEIDEERWKEFLLDKKRKEDLFS